MTSAVETFRFLEHGSPADPVVVLRSRFWNFNAIGFFDGDEACVVDPGIYPDEIEALRRAVCERAGRPPRRVTHVAVTHSHHDHIRGWMRFPGARIVFPRAGVEKSEAARTRILATKRKIDEQLGVEDEGFRYPEADIVFDERCTFTIGDLTAEMRFLPGHSNCTSVVWIPALRTLCTADYLVSPGLAYCRWEARAFESALATMRGWCESEGVTRILPAHNDPIEGADAVLAAIDLEARTFAFLRDRVRAEITGGRSREGVVREAAAAVARQRGSSGGRRARQDTDNARRILAEEWPEPVSP